MPFKNTEMPHFDSYYGFALICEVLLLPMQQQFARLLWLYLNEADLLLVVDAWLQ
jgi:hypothetical protein